ncbi:hypothetical protein EDB81DRAFT_785561 [Dactylonectria macrodidyma]|uniref:NACHT domain-containing protein n=1 Tax=Dactylonectria macrodidyma TaxID=307937 RepID=A0A9P9JK55_9HYPO|nr:hypothetical protein EDB81DRAFT_785561 [Dactylonectria macrodidyma]
MTGPDPESFKRALARFKATLEPSLQQQFATCTLTDVHQTIKGLQDKQIRDDNLRALGRLQAFVEVMDQFGQVIEVFLNANVFVCFIWGPIKFLLTTTKTFFDIFDKLVDAYSRVGDAIPGLLYYKETFEMHPPLATVLEDYYSDILNFHSEALAVFTQPRWKKLFRATWKTFETNFGPILQSLARRRELLESEKGSASLHAIQKLREEIANVQHEQKAQAAINNRERHRFRMDEIKDKLQSPNYEFDQEISTEDRGDSISGQWIFSDPSFQSWLDASSPDPKILYINGIPGAGKTTLMSTVIESLLNGKIASNGQCFVGYFYFKHQHNDTHNVMLRAILEQLLRQNSALLVQVFDEVAMLEGVNLRTTTKLENLVKTAFESYKSLYIVLDGLDECAKGETQKTVDWYLSLLDTKSKNSTSALRIIFSGQRDGVLDKRLSQQPSISLETSAHNEDIYRYCQGVCKEITTKFFKSSSLGEKAQDMKQQILSLVTSEAKGMFLYARVVLENLLAQTRLSRLKQEIRPEIFPRGIENAFDRVFARIIEHSSPAERDDAIKMLGLVVHARRILHWREIQAFFCIDPVNGEVDYNDRLQVTCKELCGSLLDILCAPNSATGSEDLVRIVHESARKYLLERHSTYLNAEGARLSNFCCQYLTSEPFQIGIDTEVVTSFAIKGYYALQDYAVQFWYDHSRAYVQCSDNSDTTQFSTIIASIRNLLNSYGQSRRGSGYQEAMDTTTIIEELNNLPEHGRDRNEHLTIELRTTLIRQQIENLQESSDLTEESAEAFTFFHGVTTLKCCKPWCEFFKGGFGTMEELQRHINRHDLPFVCNVDSCLASSIGFDSQPVLDNHLKNWHPVASEPIRFPKSRPRKSETIWSAARSGDTRAVEYFLDAGIPVNEHPARGQFQHRTPLYLAAQQGHVETCKMLLDRGADVNFSVGRIKGQTALFGSVAAGMLDTTRLLLARDEIQFKMSDRQDIASDPFEVACKIGREDIVRLFLESGKYDISHARPTSLHLLLEDACRNGNVSSVKHLLEKGFAKVADERCVNLAVINDQKSGSNHIIELLLATGNPLLTAQGLVIALDRGLLSVAKLMLHYPKLSLSENELVGFRKQAVERGYEDVVGIIDSRSNGRSQLNQNGKKLLSQSLIPIHDEFNVSTHSDTDSWSGERIGRRDYRLSQVKSRLYTSSTQVTQYWSWMEDEQLFEHQVLKSVRPATWGVHKDPIDFNVRLHEIAQVVWNIEALRVHFFMRTDGSVPAKDEQLRGDLMASFKRERTMRRFLNFCREKGVKMLKASTEEIDQRWLRMHFGQEAQGGIDGPVVSS